MAAFSVSGMKRATAEERENDEYSLKKDSEGQSKRQSHLNKLSENRRKGVVRWGEKPEEEGWLAELVGNQNPGPKAPPRSKRGRRRRSKENARRIAIAREVMEMSRYVSVIWGDGVKRR